VKKRNLVAAALSVVFILALAAPVFAMTHTASYEWDGTADMKRQVGHLCNTGAEQKVTIMGDGKMERTSTATITAGKLTVEEQSDFVTAEDAANNLVVTSVITLCAPPKMEESTTSYYAYAEEDEWVTAASAWTKLSADDLYEVHGGSPTSDTIASKARDLLLNNNNGYTEGQLRSMTDKQLAQALIDAGEDYFTLDKYRELTDQIWAVQVEANPGMSGNLHKDFEAAYGDTYASYGEDYHESADAFHADQWGFVSASNHAGYSVARGSDYVGNYFNIEQMARTSDGTLKRFIDISEPFDGSYLMEDFEVVGEVEVEEAFNMTNIAPGVDIEVLWYDLF